MGVKRFHLNKPGNYSNLTPQIDAAMVAQTNNSERGMFLT